MKGRADNMEKMNGEITVNPGMIFGLIQKAMQKVGAIGKDSVNKQQGFKYRGIDAVYNALNPVMAELGLFICPEVIDHKREERRTMKEYNGQQKESVLLYSILTIRYTIFAPDGSFISCTVIGEGMDSGDKASNKAMSVAMKYAMFQLLMIPTEEMVDPDAETHNVFPNDDQKQFTPPPAAQGTVSKTNSLPPVNPPKDQEKDQEPPKVETPPVVKYLLNEVAELRKARGITAKENNVLFAKQLEILQANGLAPKKKKEDFTQQEAETLIAMMYSRFDPKGTVLKEVVVQ